MLTYAAGSGAARLDVASRENILERFRSLATAALLHPNADIYLSSGGLDADLQENTRLSCELAFREGDPESRRVVHRVLHDLYDLQLCKPRPGLTANQHSIELLRVRRQIETSWMGWEVSRLGALPTNVSAEDIGDAIKTLWRKHPGHNHAVFDFMNAEASKDQIVKYFTTDYALNMRFYDLITLSLVGIDEDVRMEVAHNFWDEMGQGDPTRTHVRLYRDLLEYLRIEDTPEAFVDALGWEGLSGYNLLLYFAFNRREYFRSIGALAITELSDPEQYAKLLKGCRRVRIGNDRPSVLDYYSEHVEVDALHGDGWIDNVIVPILRRYPQEARAVLEGAMMRLNSSKAYWDWQLAEMKAVAPAQRPPLVVVS
ncbi:iron-containing redox enzyme family protein [Gluconacetobacter azotocaptans]|uniref:iron-containing redox enzyme family protein n=1 Tax=Gluconacetobacter azotocaptans TaxID=142834 RepID=UPI00195F1EE8|nr:iron-containing redox enzyme family protein [Gluconacetobacter azotocaptans]MBM9400849.1 iron-containing redox enzyme family protein [Gluconacetobacter azotocaptans]